MNKKSALPLLFSVFCLLLLFPFAENTQAKVKKNYEWIEVASKASSYTKVKLSWPKKKNIQKVVIYGGTPDRSGNLRYGHIVKTLSGSRTSITLTTKKKTKYAWRIEAVQKAKNNKQNIYCGEVWLYTDIESVSFDEYQYYEGETTPESIRLTFYPNDDGIAAAGTEISRRPASGGSWKVIRTITGTKTRSFTDRNVSTGEAYEYRIRGWKKIGGKKVFGQSDTVLMYAVNMFPELTLRTVESSDEELSFRLQSASGNGIITLREEDLVDASWLDRDTETVYQISGYSTDGLDWHSPEKTSAVLTLSPDSSLWFRAQKSPLSDDEDEDDYFDDFADPWWSIPANYHGQSVWYLILNLPGEDASMGQDSESVH